MADAATPWCDAPPSSPPGMVHTYCGGRLTSVFECGVHRQWVRGCASNLTEKAVSTFSGNIGDVVYDSEKKRVIVKIYDGLQGAIIDLKEYY